MRKWVIFGVVVMLMAIIVAGCGNSDGSKSDAASWGDADVQQPEIVATVSAFDADHVIGNYVETGFEVTIPKDALEPGTTVIISTGQTKTATDQAIKTLASQSVQLSIEGAQRRTTHPIRIKLKLDDKALIDLKEFEGFKGAHFSEETGWTFTTPLEVNATEGYVVYEVFNNPFWGTAELTEEARKEAFIKDKALQQWGMSQIEDDVQQMTRDMIETILVEKFNAKNKSEIEAVAKAVLSELKYGNLEYGKLATDLMNKDFGSYAANVATMVGKTFAEAYENDTLSSTFGQVGTAAAAAGYLWEGDYSGAGIKLAEAISELSPVYKIGKVAVEVIDMKINNWKANGIEEAYKAFKEGSNHYILFGYDNDPGDFDAVYDQMRGVARQIEMDAVKRYANAIGVAVNDLTQAQKDKAIARAKTDLKAQFEKRSQQEDEIAKAEDDQREVIMQFEKWGLLDKGKTWYPENMSIEQMMTRLHNQILRIQKETGRFDLVFRNGDLHDQSRGLDNIGKIKDSEMLVSHLAELISTRYVFGEEEYLKKLKEFGYAKEIELQEGTYNGVVVITEAPIIETMKKALKDPESVPPIKDADGKECEEFDILEADVQQSIREAIVKAESVVGVEVPVRIVITKGTEKGTFKAMVRVDYNAAFPDYECEEATDDPYVVTVKDGKLKLQNDLIEEGFVMSTVYEAMLKEDGVLEGTFVSSTTEAQYSSYAATEILYRGTWRVKK